MMNVIHIYPHYFENINKPEKMEMKGGGERYVFEVSKALSRKVKVKLIVFGIKRETFFMNKNLTLEIYPAINPFKPFNGMSNPLSLNFLNELKRGDIIHCHKYEADISFISSICCKMLAKKVFVTDHGWKGLSLPRLLPYSKLIDGFLALSAFSARKFSSICKRIKIVYGGVDPEAFRPVSSVKYKKIVFLGRIMPHKGVNYLIEAMHDVDAKLVIMGHIADKSFYYYLLSLSRKFSVDVDFMIDASHKKVVRELSTATALVLPSVYYDIYGKYYPQPELLGLVLLEAMACETPVICTNVGGMPEVVTDGVDGFVVPPNDHRTIREKIVFLLDNPDITVEMGKRGRKKVLQYFTWDKVAERCLSAYINQ